MADYSFPRSVRLLRPAEFTRVYRDGRRIAAGYLQIVYRSSDGEQARLGLAIAKRNLPRSVDRQRVKRQIRECFRQRRHQLPPLDMVVSLRGRKQLSAPEDFAAVLESLWQRLPTR